MQKIWLVLGGRETADLPALLFICNPLGNNTENNLQNFKLYQFLFINLPNKSKY